LRVLAGHRGAVNALAFAPDGRTLAAGSSDVRLWDLRNGNVRATLQGHSGLVNALVFSPDGRTLAMGGRHRDNAARIWDAQSGALIAVLPGHTGWVVGLAFAPDGSLLATASQDGTVRLWELPSRKVRAILPGASRPLGFSRDGRSLATRTVEGRLLLWDAGTGKPLPIPPATRLREFPRELTRPVTRAGAGVALRDATGSLTLVTLLPVPEAANASPGINRSGDSQAARGAGGESRDRGLAGGDTPPTRPDDWVAITPRGYFDGSIRAARFVRWNVGGVLYSAAQYWRRFRRPEQVRRALRGESLTAPALTADDIPPAVRFVGLEDGDAAASDPLTVTVEASDDRAISDVKLSVNGRPLPPENARAEAGAVRPTELGRDDPNHRVVRRFTFRVPLPAGAAAIHLRAVALDGTELESEAAEVTLSNRAD
jgi:hypothetical protein